MIFPIGDTNVKGGYKPIVSYSLILINVALFILQSTTPGNLVCEFATIPQDIVHGDHLYTMFSSMFLHGDWMHLLGNMLFLWIFADNIEAIVGSSKFIVFYLLGGLISSGVHIFFDLSTAAEIAGQCCIPCASTTIDCAGFTQMCAGYIPVLGASGAISAVMGAYIVMFPKSRIKMLFFITTFYIPAIFFLGLWFVEQLISGVGSLAPVSGISGGGVAWWAHIGGFVFGLIYGYLNRYKMYDVMKVNEQ